MPSQLTPSMQSVVDYFEELGPRWGLEPKSCAVHALLYLLGRPINADEVADFLDLDRETSKRAVDDLIGWGVVEHASDGTVWTSGEPWDLLFAGIEERRKREIEPALKAIGKAADLAVQDSTPRSTALRISKLHELLQDLSALSNQVGRLQSTTLKRFVHFGGQFSKLLGR